MTKLFRLACFLPLLALMACSSGQSTFYWYRPQTGINYFAKDHSACLYYSDNWPYEMPNFNIPPKPETYDLRLRTEAEDGIWAYYVALPGSQPVYVNSKVQGQWSMSVSDYENCMEDRGYRTVYEPIEDPRVGLKYCTMAGCVNAKEYNSVLEEDGKYTQTFERRYHGNRYTSHYYGADSDNFYNKEFGN